MAKLVSLHVPDDQGLLAALGKVALHHEHMNYAVRMTIKTMAEVSVDEAVLATEYEGFKQVRERARSLAKKRLGEGAALIRLQAMLARCGQLTEKRNKLIHGLWAKELDGDAHIRDAHGQHRAVPTVEELEALAKELEQHWKALNFERLEGFIKAALDARKKTDA